MAQREIIHRLTLSFRALPRDDWKKNLIWHAKRGTPVLCGPDFDWFIKDGCGDPSVLSVTRQDLNEFLPTFKRTELPVHLKRIVCVAYDAMCSPFGMEVYMDTLELASQVDVCEAMMAAIPSDEEPS